jgi:hypothetical protein
MPNFENEYEEAKLIIEDIQELRAETNISAEIALQAYLTAYRTRTLYSDGLDVAEILNQISFNLAALSNSNDVGIADVLVSIKDQLKQHNDNLEFNGTMLDQIRSSFWHMERMK